MTLRELVQQLGSFPWTVAAVLIAPLLIAAATRLLHGRDRGGLAPWRYLYSVVIYAVCLPGMFAAVLSGYTLFFIRENLLDQNLLVYFAPIVSMVVTLILVARWVRLDQVPGFDRLSGLMVVLGVTFLILFLLDRLRIWVLFGGSIFMMLALGIGLFLLLKWGMERMTGSASGNNNVEG